MSASIAADGGVAVDYSGPALNSGLWRSHGGAVESGSRPPQNPGGGSGVDEVALTEVTVELWRTRPRMPPESLPDDRARSLIH